MPSGRAGRAIGIISKAPIAGNVKSRLAVSFGPDVAATLYAAFLRDVLVCAAAVQDATVTVFHPPDDEVHVIRDLCPPGVQMEPERGAGFAEILPDALCRMLERAPVVALVGADSPGVPEDFVRQAFSAVESGEFDVAIGPATDGGYYLLAVNCDAPELFQGIAWSTSRVFAQLLSNAETLGLRVAVLPEWFDIDTEIDLERLVGELSGNGAASAPATRRALLTLRQAGHAIPTGKPAWQVEGQTVIYSTPWRTLVEDRLTIHTGEAIDYAYLQTDQAVWVVPVTPDGRVVLICQYRHPIGEFIVEVPAGGGNGDPEELARRELVEETGGRAEKFLYVASYFPASAHVTHQGHVFVALDVELGKPDLETTELLTTFTVPFELALDMARRGEIGDSQSALAILAAEPVIRAALQERQNRQREE